MSDLILYTTEDGCSQIKLPAKDQTVWLTQREMVQLFDVSMKARMSELYQKFDQDRIQRQAIEADQQDVADLQALDSKLKRRPKK